MRAHRRFGGVRGGLASTMGGLQGKGAEISLCGSVRSSHHRLLVGHSIAAVSALLRQPVSHGRRKGG